MPHSSICDRYRSAVTGACVLMFVFTMRGHLQAGDPNRPAFIGNPSARPIHGAGGALPPHRRAAVQSDNRVVAISRGSSSRTSLKDALTALPIKKLTPENQRKARQITNSISVFRELPSLAFEVNPDVYQYFISHPDCAVSIWRAMGISTFEMWQTGPVDYEADAGDGTLGLIDVLFRSNNESLVICEGIYKSPLLVRPIKATALMHLRTEFHSKQDKTFAKHRLNLFVDFPSTTVETAAKIISPVSNLIVDRNFYEVSMFLHMMSAATIKRPDWVEQIVEKMDGVLEPSKNELVDLTTRLHESNRIRSSRSATGQSKFTKTKERPGASSTAFSKRQPPERVASTEQPTATQ